MKRNRILFVILLTVYIVGTLLCRFYFGDGMDYESYTAGWLFRRSFMYTWLIMAVFLLINKPFAATFTTIGCFLGMVVGDITGSMIIDYRLARIENLVNAGQIVDEDTIYFAQTHYGILPIWFIFIMAMIVVGLVLDYKISEGK